MYLTGFQISFFCQVHVRNKLREANPGNALLELRGNAGSHDLAFSVQTLAALTKLTREGMKLKLSRYDKVRMLGLKPLPVDTVKVVDPQAEIAMRETGNLGMIDDEVRDFVSCYLPAYYDRALLFFQFLEG
ncbi:hypothetical protein GYH30_000556 [Glycine max]|nr:hypothetical protein GYH30_000556 [Glycine max]